VGKSNPPVEEEEVDEFDPFLGLLLGETWWKLGKNFGPALTGSDDDRAAYLAKWSAELREQLLEEEMKESLDAINPDSLRQFISTAMSLLEKKYDHGNIAKDVDRLTKKANEANIYDVGQYIDIQEPTEVFWANEYDFLFRDLVKPLEGRGWLNAVARCAASSCQTFFIKQRKDQRYHTDACRTRTANREAYNKGKGSKPHTKRGRPRLRP
jgi:hypothetical protein